MLGPVDGNNFYAFCERIFNPSLRGRPVVVLSYNDGCAIARSQEAKDLGVGMGQPIHEVPPEVCRQLKVLSANFGLYGDFVRARRVDPAGLVPPGRGHRLTRLGGANSSG